MSKQHIKINADGSATVTLAKGVEVSGARVMVMTLREPTVADQIAAQESGRNAAHQEVTLISNLAQITPEELGALTLRDYRRLQEALAGFSA